jgi:hypothetical protein
MSSSSAHLCEQFAEAMQRMLDGEANSLSEPLESHRIECDDCRRFAESAANLTVALADLPRLEADEVLTSRIIAAVEADRAIPPPKRHLTRRIVTAIVVIAASIAVLWFAGEWTSVGRTNQMVSSHSVRPPAAKVKSNPSSFDMRDNLEVVAESIASLTRRTASDVIGPARDVFGLGVEMDWLRGPAEVRDHANPAMDSLQELRHGAAAGFEPIAESARRALAMFTRDLPTKPSTKP